MIPFDQAKGIRALLIIITIIALFFTQILMNTRYQKASARVRRLEKKIRVSRLERYQLKTVLDENSRPEEVIRNLASETIRRKKLDRIPVVHFDVENRRAQAVQAR